MSALTVTIRTSPPAPRLRRRPVPVSAPYAAVHVLPPPDPRPLPTQGTLMLQPGAVSPQTRPADVPRPRTDASDAARWAGQFVQAAVEVAAGMRPPTQLTRWATQEVRDALAQRGSLNRRARPGEGARRTVVRSVRASHPTAGVTEASAVVTDGPRFRAVALRMEAFEGRWRVTALQIG